MLDIIISLFVEDYADSLLEYASQTFAVRSKTDKSLLTNKTLVLDVYAKRHHLENVVRTKQESEARTQSHKRDKKYNRSCKNMHRSVRRLRVYSPTFCLVQQHYGCGCIHPFLTCKHCLQSVTHGRI